MSEVKRKISKKSFGGYKLISVKDPGVSWDGIIWVKVKSLKEFDALSEEEQSKVYLQKCPKGVPSMCFPADGYPLVRHECKECRDMAGHDHGNCPFLFRYANGGYGCRLKEKTAQDMVYYDW